MTSALGLGLALALVPGTVALAAPQPAQAPAAAVATATRSTPTILLRTSADYYYRGRAGVVVTATVVAVGGAAKGKVSFYDGTKRLKTLALSKGRASYRLPSTLAARTHTITVKFAPSASTVAAASKRVKIAVMAAAVRTQKTTYVVYLENFVPVKIYTRNVGKVTYPWVHQWQTKVGSDPTNSTLLAEVKGSYSKGVHTGSAVQWLMASSYNTKYLNRTGTYTWWTTYVPQIGKPAMAKSAFKVVVRSNVLTVGKDIKPGTYRLAAGKYSGSCSWRVVQADGNYRYSTSRTGTQTVTIKATDTEFKFESCSGGPVAS